MSGLPPFQRFLDEQREDVYRFLVASVGPVEADDCFQETFMAALQAYPRLRAGSNLRAWALTIAHRKAIDSARRRAVRAVPVSDVDEAASLPVDAAEGSRDGALWDAVRSLTPRRRAAVVLFYVGDLSHREIAAVLGCSEEAARRALADAMKRLREVYAR